MLSNRALYFAVHGRPAPRKAPRRRTGRGPARNWKYRGWVRTLPCACHIVEMELGEAGAWSPCFGAVQAAHTVNNGRGSKGSDYSCVPLCAYHHQEYDNGLRSKDLFEADHNISMAGLVARLNHEWFAHSREMK